MLGSLAIAGSATVAIGPPIGGLLVGGLGWRSAFLLNVPLAAAALAVTLAWIPRDEHSAAGRKVAELATRIDVGGIVLFGGMLAALLVFLMSLPRPGWAGLAISAVLAVLLVAWELRAARPFIDLRLLASARALIACAFFMLLASAATLFITSQSPVIALVAVMVLFGVVVGTTSVGNQTALYLQSRPEISAPPRACCGPSATSGRSPRRRSPASSSTSASPTPACTTWRSSSSASPPSSCS